MQFQLQYHSRGFMDNKKIEEKLKEKYKSVKAENFSERLSRIRESLGHIPKEQEAVINVKSAVTATHAGTITSSNRTKLIAVISVISVVFFIAIAVFIWWFVSSSRHQYSMEMAELFYARVQKNEFEDAMDGAGFNKIDFVEVEDSIYYYGILQDDGGNIYGGMVQFSNETSGNEGRVEFYASEVVGINEVEEPCNFYTITSSDLLIRYITEVDREYMLYATTASTGFDGVNYYIEYMSINNDSLQFIEALFT